MKKLFLLLLAGSMFHGATAQSGQGVEGGQVQPVKVSVNDYGLDFSKVNRSTESTGKTTAAAPRWYSPIDMFDKYSGGQTSVNQLPIWFDSTVRQRFSTGLGTINFSSAAQVIEPSSLEDVLFNDGGQGAYPGQMMVMDHNAYHIDSIRFQGAYVKNQNRPSSIVDTFIISVAPQSGFYYWRRATAAWVGTYIPADKDTLVAFAPLKEDRPNKAAFSDVGDSVTNRRIWRVLLTDADRDTVNTQNNTVTVKDFVYAVPSGGLDMPADGRFSVTVTFRSGDVVANPNVDTFSAYHNFRLMSGEASTGQAMPYWYYQYRDRNNASLWFSTSENGYSPSVGIEGTNQNSFRQEIHNIDALVSCATCHNVNVNNVSSNLVRTGAYPNPVGEYVKVSFNLNKAADVKITLTNAVGQVVDSKVVNNTTNDEVTFNTSNLSNGLYFYTVDADGQRMTNRIVVSH